MPKSSSTSDKLHTDVLIVGAGPAGLASAIFLRQRGFEVIIADRRKRERHPIGESLAPVAGVLLEQLGVWDEFCEGPHLRCYGNKSAWGAPELHYADFINSQYGHGWHIDRRHFEAMLYKKAETEGVSFKEVAGPFSAEQEVEGWKMSFKGSDRQVCPDFMIDATGRSSSVARALGARRLTTREQLALAVFLKTEHELEDTTSLVETVASGWLYSAALPGGRLVVCYFTAAGGADVKGRAKDWEAIVHAAPATSARVNSCGGCTALELPGFTDASEGRLDQFAGPGWLAVGDAACSYDPVTAHGLTFALTSARDASVAIAQTLEGNNLAMNAYADQMDGVFEHTRRQCIDIYRSERRWPLSPFWCQFRV